MVLIVEDDDAVRDALREALVAEDYAAISVGTLDLARRLLAEVKFDALLLDGLLAGENAAELLDELSAGSSPPALLVSAATSAEDTARNYTVPLLPKAVRSR